MLKSKLEKFIALRVLIFYVAFSLVGLIFLHSRWILFIGFALGGIIGLLRFGSMSTSFYRLLPQADKQTAVRGSIFKYILNQALTVAALIVSLKVSLWVFLGMIAGILLVPIVIIFNGITEFLGITHNNYE